MVGILQQENEENWKCTDCKSAQENWSVNSLKTIQFVEKKKSLKKGVDKRERRWYDNKAVARKSEGKELKRLMNSGIQSRNGLE